MNRSVIADAALSAAKAYSHAEIEPRHVVFALARQLKLLGLDLEPLHVGPGRPPGK